MLNRPHFSLRSCAPSRTNSSVWLKNFNSSPRGLSGCASKFREETGMAREDERERVSHNPVITTRVCHSTKSVRDSLLFLCTSRVDEARCDRTREVLMDYGTRKEYHYSNHYRTNPLSRGLPRVSRRLVPTSDSIDFRQCLSNGLDCRATIAAGHRLYFSGDVVTRGY